MIGTKNVSRISNSEESQREALLVCFFTAVRQKFECALLTACTIPMNERNVLVTARVRNERFVRWNNIVRSLANRNDGQVILMDLEHNLRALDQTRIFIGGILLDNIKGRAWMNRFFQDRLNDLKFKLFDTRKLRTKEATNVTAMSTFVPLNLETHLGSVPAVPRTVQSSIEQKIISDVLARLGEPLARRTIGQTLGPVNQTYTSSDRSQ